MIRIVVVGFALLATGCVSMLSYEGESSGPVTRVRFAIPKDSGFQTAIIRSYADENCTGEQEWLRLSSVAVIPAPLKRLGLPLWEFDEKGAQELKIRAGATLNLMFETTEFVGTTNYKCGVMVGANLAQGRDYEFLFLPGFKSCSVVLHEFADREGAPERVVRQVFPNTGTDGCRSVFSRYRALG